MGKGENEKRGSSENAKNGKVLTGNGEVCVPFSPFPIFRVPGFHKCLRRTPISPTTPAAIAPASQRRVVVLQPVVGSA